MQLLLGYNPQLCPRGRVVLLHTCKESSRNTAGMTMWYDAKRYTCRASAVNTKS